MRALLLTVFLGATMGASCTRPSAATPEPTTSDVVTAPATGRTLRFLSLAVRDQPPSLEETRAFAAGERPLDSFTNEWLASPQHLAHVRRYFADFFGISAGFTPFDQFLLEKNADGVYRLPKKPDCTLDEAVLVPAWWLEEGETILICPTSTSDAFVFPSEDPEVVAVCGDHDPKNTSDGCSVLCNSVFNLELDPRCGCGPGQLMCMPCELPGTDFCDAEQGRARSRDVEREFNIETIERGVFAYENGLSWFDYLGGDFFYGNRSLYLYYVLAQGHHLTGELSGDDALAQVWAIPMHERVRAPWPAGFARAGVVTSPGFLSTYNTFRGRARVLSQRLLCHDVDETLNVDGYQTFRNPSLSDADRAHGENPSCNFCHYGLDNQASMLFGYDLTATAAYDHTPIPSQLGHVFGVDDEGPAALVRGYVEGADGFDACMAQRAFASFTGLDWQQALTDADRAELTRVAHDGPRGLIQTILTSPVLRTASAE